MSIRIRNRSFRLVLPLLLLLPPYQSRRRRRRLRPDYCANNWFLVCNNTVSLYNWQSRSDAPAIDVILVAAHEWMERRKFHFSRPRFTLAIANRQPTPATSTTTTTTFIARCSLVNSMYFPSLHHLFDQLHLSSSIHPPTPTPKTT